jgi:uncharacterized damage-inducible protein DinB
MTAKDSILTTYDLSDRITKAYLDGLTAADLLIRPIPGQNHIAWQLGHLLLTEKNFVDMIRPGTSPALPENFEEGHGRDKTNVDDASKYLAPEDYLRLIAAQRAATKSLLASLSDAELDAPGPEKVRQMCPTVGSTLLMIGNHDLMHVGQYVAVRRKLGKPVAI